MLTLCQFPSAPMIPNFGPFCMKIECVLRMLDLNYQVELIQDFENAPRHQVPYIIDETETIGDSRVIAAHLQRKQGVDLDRHLSVEQWAAASALRSMLEQDLYFAMVYSRWADEDGWAKARPLFFGAVPESQRNAVAEAIRSETLARLYQQGIGRHDREQVYRFAGESLDAAAAMLGGSSFVFGETPGLTDAVLYAFVANLSIPLFDGPLRHRTLSHRNLIAHADRMRDRYFSSMPALAA